MPYLTPLSGFSCFSNWYRLATLVTFSSRSNSLRNEPGLSSLLRVVRKATRLSPSMETPETSAAFSACRTLVEPSSFTSESSPANDCATMMTGVPLSS